MVDIANSNQIMKWNWEMLIQYLRPSQYVIELVGTLQQIFYCINRCVWLLSMTQYEIYRIQR